MRSSEMGPSSHNPPALQDVFNNLQAILKDSKQNSHQYAQAAQRCTYLRNHVNEDQSQTAKKK